MELDLRAALTSSLGDRYTVERELGVGGMAVVYAARDLKHRRMVAIKVLRSETALVSGPHRFLREIDLTANLQHPHILPLLDSGTISVHGFEVPYYVMPLVAGQSLRLEMDLTGRLTVERTLAIARDVGQALGFAHSRGVVHRDIKPENILLSESGAAIVADFGVAQAAAGEGGHSGAAPGRADSAGARGRSASSSRLRDGTATRDGSPSGGAV